MDSEAKKLFNGDVWAKDGDRIDVDSSSLSVPVNRADGFSNEYSVNTDPPRELFNQILCETTSAAKEVIMGVSQWDPEVDYPAGAITNVNGTLYHTSSGGKNKNPQTQSSVWSNLGSRITPSNSAPSKITTSNIFIDGERSDKFRVYWNNPDDGGDPITSATLYYSVNSDMSGATSATYTQGTYIDISGNDSDRYYIQITVTNSIGTSTKSDAMKVRSSALTPPPVSEFSTATGNASGRVDLNWIAVTPSNGLTISKYRVEWKSGSEEFTSTGTRHQDVTSGSSQNITGLTNGTAYTFRVVTISNRGTENAGTFTAIKTPINNASVPSKPSAPLLSSNYLNIVAGINPPNDNGASITKYKWQYKKSTDSDWSDTIQTTVPYINLTNLDKEAYKIKSIASNIHGDSEWSDESTINVNFANPTVGPPKRIHNGNSYHFNVDISNVNSGGGSISEVQWEIRGRSKQYTNSDWTNWTSWKTPVTDSHLVITTNSGGLGLDQLIMQYDNLDGPYRNIVPYYIGDKNAIQFQARIRIRTSKGWSDWSSNSTNIY